MPKKKTKKPSHGGGKEERTFTVDDPSENPSDATDSDKKYSRRQCVSNWDRYRPVSPEKPEEEENSYTSSFSDLFSAPSDCNYFRFKSEKNWESEANKNAFSGHKFFSLDLEVLTGGLATIPFYEQVGIDKSIFSEEHIERCDKKAAEGLARYESIRERFLKTQQQTFQSPESQEQEAEVEPVQEVKQNFVNDKVIPANVTNVLPEEINTVETIKEEVQQLNLNTASDVKYLKQESVKDENLEEWLDTILDD